MVEMMAEKAMEASEKVASSDGESIRPDSTDNPSNSAKAHKTVIEQSNELKPLTGPKLYAVLGALALVVMMFSLDTMVMITAIPKITDEFHTIVDIGWYVTAYMLCTAALQPLTGKMYTYYNLTYSYLGFIALFEVGSIVCATAPTSAALVIGRAIAGMGASGLTNGSLTIIGVAAPREQRPALMAVIMAVLGLGQIIAPLVGGLFSEHVTWRWCFWINLPIGAASAIALLFLRIPNPNQRGGLTLRTFVRRFDIVGFGIFAPACVMILLAFQWGGNQHAWKSATIIGLLCGSVLAFCLFVVWERHQGEDAMFPGSLMKQRIMYSSCVTNAVQSGAMFVSSYYIALWFQAVKRSSPTLSAVYTLPTFGLQIIGVVVSTMIISRIGFFTPFSVIGNALIALGNGLMATFSPATGVGSWVGFQIMVGTGRGFCFQQPINAIQANLSGDQMSTGMAIVAWAQFFGGAVFIALADTTFTSSLRSAVHKFTPSISPKAVIDAGATNYLSLATNGTTTTTTTTLTEMNDLSRNLLTAYNQAIVHVFYLAVGLSVLGTFSAFGMGWKRVLNSSTKASTTKEKTISTATTPAITVTDQTVNIGHNADKDEEKI